MKFRKSKLKRKLKSGNKSVAKKAKRTMEELKLYTLSMEHQAKLNNSVAHEVFTEVARRAGDKAYQVFSYVDWKLSKRERAARLYGMYKGPKKQDEAKALDLATKEVLNQASEEK